MSWHYELICDSCNFKRNKVTSENTLDADEHELGTADHWVQLVQVENETEIPTSS